MLLKRNPLLGLDLLDVLRLRKAEVVYRYAKDRLSRVQSELRYRRISLLGRIAFELDDMLCRHERIKMLVRVEKTS